MESYSTDARLRKKVEENKGNEVEKRREKRRRRQDEERKYGSCATERYTLQTEFLRRVAAMQLVAFGSVRIKELSVW